MILLIDTSTALCKTYWVNGESLEGEVWHADRELANGLLGYLRTQLTKRNSTWVDITGIGVYRGPGSFTGLRIGHTVMNTIAGDLSVPIVGANGDDWIDAVLQRLRHNENDELVMPLYGREANITTPCK
jgi:tRNA threonylcarbamoyladenosine biosynthesis protein TsaB